jgi:hypothetical protein
MAEMRFRARPTILLAGLLLLALPALAAAQPQPIPKPKDVTPIAPKAAPPPATPQPSPPPSPPSASTASGGSTSGSTGTGTTATSTSGSTGTGTTATSTTGATGTGTTGTTGATGTGATGAETVIVATAEGGRDQSGLALPVATPPEPTPLGLVAAGDRVSSPGTSTPAWKIALLALLAAAEAFLIVRLVLNRPRGDLSPAA